jgi:3-dehydroquinate synthase
MIISDLHTALLPYLEATPNKQVFVLTDANVASCYPTLIGKYPHCILPAGDNNKSLHSVELVWQFLLENGATRDALLLNIGGGMITDLGGFVAATYMRGIRCVNIPTSLLAMVDASTGGKTGINILGLKNLVGTFTQPSATLIYPPFLNTLSENEILSGYAEMLKHGLIADPAHFYALLAIELQMPYSELFAPLLSDSIQVKRQIVSADFQEKGLRKALNFGHTIGHAIEESYAVQGRTVAHGYCVLWGMVAELYLSVIKMGCPRNVLTQMSHLMISLYGRPECNCRQVETLKHWMLKDKKNFIEASSSRPQISFTLLRNIGETVVDQTVSDSELDEALEYLFSL